MSSSYYKLKILNDLSKYSLFLKKERIKKAKMFVHNLRKKCNDNSLILVRIDKDFYICKHKILDKLYNTIGYHIYNNFAHASPYLLANYRIAIEYYQNSPDFFPIFVEIVVSLKYGIIKNHHKYSRINITRPDMLNEYLGKKCTKVISADYYNSAYSYNRLHLTYDGTYEELEKVNFKP